MTPARTLVALGALGVVLGGLVAAVTGPMDWAKGSWAAAYLVLVVGVAQYVMGRLRAVDATSDRVGWVQVAGWNLGSLLVIGGTLVTTPLLVDLGSVLLVVALVLALVLPPVLAVATRGKYYLRRGDDGIDLPMFDEYGNPSGEKLLCCVTGVEFERPDMVASAVPGPDGEKQYISSLALSTDKSGAHVLPADPPVK